MASRRRQASLPALLARSHPGPQKEGPDRRLRYILFRVVPEPPIQMEMTTTGMRGRLWLLYVAAGLAVAVASLRLPDLAHSIVYQLTGLSAVAAILARMRLHRPARRGIWYGLGVFVAGDVVYSVYVYVLHREPFPSPADGLYLAGLIDALIITTGLGLLSWMFLMGPIAADASLGLGSG